MVKSTSAAVYLQNNNKLLLKNLALQVYLIIYLKSSRHLQCRTPSPERVLR